MPIYDTEIDELTAYYFGFFNLPANPSMQFWDNIKRLCIVKDVDWCQLREDYCVLDTDMGF